MADKRQSLGRGRGKTARTAILAAAIGGGLALTLLPLPPRLLSPGLAHAESEASGLLPATEPAATPDEGLRPAEPPRPQPIPEPKPQPAPGGRGPDRFEVEEEQIYFGEPEDFERPAVIEARRAYEAIPEYRRIAQQGLTRDNPEYWPLMRRAAAAFVRALKAVCREKGYDLVGEIDSIQPKEERSGAQDEVPEITEAVVARIERR